MYELEELVKKLPNLMAGYGLRDCICKIEHTEKHFTQPYYLAVGSKYNVELLKFEIVSPFFTSNEASEAMRKLGFQVVWTRNTWYIMEDFSCCGSGDTPDIYGVLKAELKGVPQNDLQHALNAGLAYLIEHKFEAVKKAVIGAVIC